MTRAKELPTNPQAPVIKIFMRDQNLQTLPGFMGQREVV